MNHVDELISASLTGDLTDLEQAQLEQHLRECDSCRLTMAAYGDQRRLVGGLRHVAPPRDLDARVRAGIEAGAFARRSWWRRSSGILAVVGGLGAVAAGAVLGLAVLNTAPSDPQVGGSDSPSPSASAQTTPEAKPSTAPTSQAPAASASATPAATPTPLPEIGYGAINYLALDGPLGEQRLTLQVFDPALDESRELLELDTPSGPPLSASFSPDYQWLIYQSDVGLKGTRAIRAVNVLTNDEVALGEVPGDDAFAKRVTWSLDGRFLAYTARTEDGVDAFIFDSEQGSFERLTFDGSVYAASFDGERLWVSVAGDLPVSYLVPLDGDLSDLPAAAIETADGVFLPILSPNGERSLFWRGAMAERGDQGSWSFVSGGMLQLAEGNFASGRPIFPGLTADRDAFLSAELAWSYDSDWFAVWNAAWTGLPQTDRDGQPFPNPNAVYAARASTDDMIEMDDVPFGPAGESGRIVDVRFVGYDFGGDVPAIVTTVFEAAGGESQGAPGSQSRLLLSPAGGTDSVIEIGGEFDWAGPAMYAVQPEDTN